MGQEGKAGREGVVIRTHCSPEATGNFNKAAPLISTPHGGPSLERRSLAPVFISVCLFAVLRSRPSLKCDFFPPSLSVSPT